MIPLLVLFALGAAALGAYEFSSKTHGWVDDHVQAIRDAVAAHHEADTHLDAAQAAVDTHQAVVSTAQPQLPPGPQDPWGPPPVPGTGSDPLGLLSHAIGSLIAAGQANLAAAAATITAAKTAKTPPERAAAAQSAASVEMRKKVIDAGLASLGEGQCHARTYARVTVAKVNALLARLHAKGMAVTGSNPWDIDTHTSGVKLRGVWDPTAQVLHLIVTASDPLAPCFAIWNELEDALRPSLV